MSLKNESYNALNEYQVLGSLRSERQLSLINKISKALPQSATRILKWDYRGNDEINIVLGDLNPDLEQYVESIENTPGIKGVDITPAGSNQVKLLVRLE